MPKISVIVPVYNVEPYLNRCVESILKQTFSDFELILIDDGSTDNSGIICDEYIEKDERIIVFHQTNRGQAAARNMAIDWILANSISDYITFVDSDDWIHPKYLELLYTANQHYKTHISQCLYVEMDGTIIIPPVGKRISLVTIKEQYINWYSAFFWGKLFHVKVWEDIRFPEGQIYEDVAIWYKILFAEKNVGSVKEVLYYYFINQTGTVRSEWIPAKLKQIDAWEDQISFFASYGDKTLFDCVAMHYLQILQSQLTNISKSKSISWLERIRYGFFVRQKLQNAIFRFRKTPYYILNKHLILNNAFPRIMWLYWTIYGIKNKFMNLLKKKR